MKVGGRNTVAELSDGEPTFRMFQPRGVASIFKENMMDHKDAGWPTKNGSDNPSGPGRDNNPPGGK